MNCRISAPDITVLSVFEKNSRGNQIGNPAVHKPLTFNYRPSLLSLFFVVSEMLRDRLIVILRDRYLCDNPDQTLIRPVGLQTP